uniref:VWFA domain-containing protein n=1 Tax=Aureoumbra lagunensis TaxID=44058 RepID=A0A7S3JWN9_9STRA|mmetsp:Transcript_2894/g.4035  ORF Transcript_2894/g.4035 Transcript_2894/m.4035 type:complete len:1100 (-) Transcript_2894:763-4062(-)
MTEIQIVLMLKDKSILDRLSRCIGAIGTRCHIHGVVLAMGTVVSLQQAEDCLDQALRQWARNVSTNLKLSQPVLNVLPWPALLGEQLTLAIDVPGLKDLATTIVKVLGSSFGSSFHTLSALKIGFFHGARKVIYAKKSFEIARQYEIQDVIVSSNKLHILDSNNNIIGDAFFGGKRIREKNFNLIPPPVLLTRTTSTGKHVKPQRLMRTRSECIDKKTMTQVRGTARAVRLAANRWTIGVQLPCYSAEVESRIAFHFALDNSGSMGRHSESCKNSFAGLLDIATEDCSLTIFDSVATTLSASLRRPDAMRSLRLPMQGRTNISAGVASAVDCIIRLGKLDVHHDVHHVLVLLSDGQHNVGSQPRYAFQEAKTKLAESLDLEKLKLSVLVIGISSSSDTSVGMCLRSTFETVTLSNCQPIYYVESVNDAQRALAQLTTDLRHAAFSGRLLSIRCLCTQGQEGGWLEDAGRPVKPVIDEFVAGEDELTLLFAGNQYPAALEIRSSLVTSYIAVELEKQFNIELVSSAINKVVNRYSIERIAGTSQIASSAATELQLLADEFEQAATEEGRRVRAENEASASLKKRAKQHRLAAFRAAATTLTTARELKNKLREIAALSSASSRDQAHFLTGASTKYGGKALARAATKKKNKDQDLLSSQLRQRLRVALLEDIRARIAKNERLAKAVSQKSTDLDTLLFADDGAWFTDTARDTGDNGLTAAVSYVSLQCNVELLAEWVSTCTRPVTEYEYLVAFGFIGVPIQLDRRAATLMNPFEMKISRVADGSFVDSASLAGALRGASPILPPEGGREVQDLLLLVDPALPRSSALALASPLMDKWISMTLCRDLDMYQGVSQRIALASHSLLCVLGGDSDDEALQLDVEADFKRAFGGRTVYQCARCGFGPVDHHSCSDLFSHHGEQSGNAVASNACPKCSWFSDCIHDWDLWDGQIPSEVLKEGRLRREKKSSSLSTSQALLALRIGYSMRQIWRLHATKIVVGSRLKEKIVHVMPWVLLLMTQAFLKFYRWKRPNQLRPMFVASAMLHFLSQVKRQMKQFSGLKVLSSPTSVLFLLVAIYSKLSMAVLGKILKLILKMIMLTIMYTL